MIGTDAKSTEIARACLNEGVRFATLMGGTEAAKTFGLLVAFWLYTSTVKATGEKPIITIVAITNVHLEKGAIRDWESIVKGRPEVKMVSKRPRIYECNGWTIEFYAVDKPSKAHGPRRRHILIDEINHIPKEIVIQLMQRTKGTVFATFNPTARFWWYDHFIQNRSRSFWKRLTWRDNPYASEETVKDILSWKVNDPRRYEIYGEGKTGQIEGLVHPEISLRPFPTEDIFSWTSYGIDYGFTGDPTVVVFVGHSEGSIYIKEIYRAPTVDPKEVSLALKSDGANQPIWADNAPVFTAALVRLGHDVRAAPKPAGSVESGIAVLNGYNIVIDVNSSYLVKDFQTYSRREVAGEFKEPLHKGSDGCDASRYAVIGHTQPKPKKKRAGRLHALGI